MHISRRFFLSNKHRGFTIIEVIVSITVVSVIFASLYSATNLLFDYISDSNGRIAAMNLAVSGIEKFRIYKVKRFTTTMDSQWSTFVTSLPIGYYTFSGTDIDPIPFTGSPLDYLTWEGPLDDEGRVKSNNLGTSFYRLMSFTDYDTSAKTPLDLANPSLPLYATDTGTSLIKTNISYPILQSVLRTATGLTLTFTPGYTIYQQNALFVHAPAGGNFPITKSGSFTISTGAFMNSTGSVASIDFGASNVTIGNSLTVSGTTFQYGVSSVAGNIPVPVGTTLDESIVNMQTIMNQNLDDFHMYFFKPTVYNITEKLHLYNQSLFPDSGVTSVTTQGNLLSVLMDSASMDRIGTDSIDPTHLLRFATGTITGTSWSDLLTYDADKTGGKGVSYVTGSTNATGVSSLYKVTAKVIVTKNGYPSGDEGISAFIGDTH